MTAARKIEPTWETALFIAVRDGDALLFATDVLGFLKPGVPNPANAPQLEPWQVKALKMFSKAFISRFKKPGRIAIRSGHGVGKTCFLSIIVLFTLLAGGSDVKVPVVANSQNQLRDVLWPEISKWRNKLPAGLIDQIVWQAERISLRAEPESVFAVARTASKNQPEALQGFHSETLLAIFEEASGIPELTIETAQGALSTPGAMAIAVGNPTRRAGFFFNIFHKPELRSEWQTMKVSSEEVPRARGHIQSIINLYGKDSNKYRVRVLGEFPTKDDDVVIPLEWAESAKGRQLKRSHVYPVWGCDAARFGDDRITLFKRMGNTMLRGSRVWRNLDGKQVADRIVADYVATENDLKPKAICVDVIGYGASVVDFLRYNPILTEDEVSIVSVNVAESASNDDLNHRLRDELWWKGREWFQGLDVCIEVRDMTTEELALIEELIGELTTPTYDFTAAGKRIVQPKAEIKEDVGRSPDLADGFLNTFACPVYPRPIEDSDRHRRMRGYEPDPWAS